MDDNGLSGFGRMLRLGMLANIDFERQITQTITVGDWTTLMIIFTKGRELLEEDVADAVGMEYDPETDGEFDVEIIRQRIGEMPTGEERSRAMALSRFYNEVLRIGQAMEQQACDQYPDLSKAVDHGLPMVDGRGLVRSLEQAASERDLTVDELIDKMTGLEKESADAIRHYYHQHKNRD